MPASQEQGRHNGIPHETGRGKSREPVISFNHKEGVHMARLSFCLMFVLICCLLSGCNPTGASGNLSQQAIGNEGRFSDQRDPEKGSVVNGSGEAEKRSEVSDNPEQGVESAPFAEERLAHRPIRTGGMPTIENPKGILYSDNASSMARE
jgi:hypothetical protein